MEHTVLGQQNWLEILDGQGALHYGANQEWYGQFWRRKAGCGPTTAAVQMAFLAHTRPSLKRLCALETLEKNPFISYMNNVWEYVTPGPQGLNTIEKYSVGVRDFAQAHGTVVFPRTFGVPSNMLQCPEFRFCLAFLQEGLRSGCPVAFLNLHNGRVNNLDRWHWVLLTGLRTDGASAMATMADAGKKVEIDLRLWYDTTKGGGGFVYLSELCPV